MQISGLLLQKSVRLIDLIQYKERNASGVESEQNARVQIIKGTLDERNLVCGKQKRFLVGLNEDGWTNLKGAVLGVVFLQNTCQYKNMKKKFL